MNRGILEFQAPHIGAFYFYTALQIKVLQSGQAGQRLQS
jgi:hypothetical protein